MSAGGRPPQRPDRSGRSLAQMSIAKQIAEASKSPRPARSGDRHSRCPQRAELLVLAPSAESANLCESVGPGLRLPRALLALANKAGGHRRAGPRPAVDLQPIAV